MPKFVLKEMESLYVEEMTTQVENFSAHKFRGKCQFSFPFPDQPVESEPGVPPRAARQGTRRLKVQVRQEKQVSSLNLSCGGRCYE